MRANYSSAWEQGTIIQSLSRAKIKRVRVLNQRELNKLIGSVERKGYTLVPLRLYWKSNRVKLEIALAKGKKLHDKRADEKNKDWERQKNRSLKEFNNE